MTEQPSAPPGEGNAAALLAIMRDLMVELHPHKREGTRITLDSSLEQEMGFDSLSRVELLLRVEQAFGINLAEHLIAAAETPADLLRAMAGAQPSGDGAPAAPGAGIMLDAVEERPDSAGTLVDVMEWHATRHPERPHVTLMGEIGEPLEMTYGDLLDEARKIAAGLLEMDVRPGQPVAIMLPTCLEYFHSFMGIFLAGGVPVPIYPPARLSQIEDHLRRHASILDNARTQVLITVPEAKIAARLLKMQVLSLRHILTPQELSGRNSESPRFGSSGGDIAYLQYTSGSTGNPKGVVLTHDNLLSNIRAMGAVLRADSTDVFVSWLPLYHDMGLIGAWLGSMYFSIPLKLMSPLTFLARPERWLWAIHQHRGTFSGGPNFAYEFCLRRVRDEQIEGLDLSSWRIAFNGAEPVIPQTLRRFQARFSPYGLRPDALKPVYGLAECSVGLSFPPMGREFLVDRVQREPLDRDGRALPAGEGHTNALEFVTCGLPLPKHEVRIVNEAGQELGEREEGRLQFKGPSACSGYYRNAEESQRLLHGEWLDSGDIAYIAEGDIYLTGRRKDIVIRAGRNIYPHELEDAIGELDGVRRGCVAVFGSTDPQTGTERLVALAETRETDPARLNGIRRAIDEMAVNLLEISLDDVILAPPHTVPKTSSGKIRRAASRELYEKGGILGGTSAVWLQVARLWLTGLVPQVRRMRRVALDLLFAAYGTVCFALVAPFAWLLVTALPNPRWCWAVVRSAGRVLLGMMGIPVRVSGMENMTGVAPCVLAINHSSYLDGLIVSVAFPGAWSFVAKRELVDSFVSRLFLRHLTTEFVERFDMQRGIEDARRISKAAVQGRSLVFFPEGTLRRNPGLLPFHMGAFQAAVEAQVPVVPVVMRGTRSVLRDGQWLLRRGRITVQVFPPIAPEGTGWNAAIELRDQVRAQMLRHCGEPDLAERPVLL